MHATSLSKVICAATARDVIDRMYVASQHGVRAYEYDPQGT